MLIGATFAWFTDTASNTGNRIQAGNLDIDLLMDKGSGYVSIAGGTGDIFKEAAIAQNSNATLWEPGKTQFAKLAVENKGNLALKYNAYIDVTDEGLVGSLEYAMISSKTPVDLTYSTWSDLKDAVKAAGGVTGDVVSGRTTTIKSGILDEIAKGIKNERDYVTLAVHMKEDAGNEYQGKDAVIDVHISAAQYTAEEDGFGTNTYDADAEIVVPAEIVHVTGVSVDEETTTVCIGKSVKLTAKVSPDDATNKNVTWSSDKENIAEVDDEGNVKGVSEGTANITVTTEDGNKSATCKVKVTGDDCFASGTRITMADGSLKNIEYISAGDSVLTFNHETGEYEAQEVDIAYRCEYAKPAFTLAFDNGTELSIVGEHDLFEKESNKYVMITDENAESFIGNNFYSSADNGYVRLICVTYSDNPVDYYSLYTEKNYNCIAEGMLTLPDDVDEYLNLYEFDENLVIDQLQLARDIEKYGLYEYSGDEPFTKDEYDNYQGKYLNIMIGKGLVTWDELVNKHYQALNNYH